MTEVRFDQEVEVKTWPLVNKIYGTRTDVKEFTHQPKTIITKRYNAFLGFRKMFS